MEFGTSKFKPLLTIAIPTWNRDLHLKSALERLLPELDPFSDLIELVVCDNASDDATATVVKTIFDANNHIKSVYFRQSANSGFYGNFKKAVSLSSGKYLWILSDDDHIFAGLIKLIIDILRLQEAIGAIFLSDWTDNPDDVELLQYTLENQTSFFKQGNFRHTLISSIIYANTIEGDDIIFEQLKGNALIAYPVFVKAVSEYNNFAIIRGNSLIISKDENVRFNALTIFTLELAECFKVLKGYLPDHLINFIANAFLSTLTAKHYRDFRYKGLYSTGGKSFFRIFEYYLKFKNFYFHILPVRLLSEKVYWNFRRGAKKLSAK